MKPEREFDSAGSLLRLVLPVDAPPNERTTRSAPRRASRTTNARTTETRPLSRARVTRQSQSRALASLRRRDACDSIPPRVGWLVDFHAKKALGHRTDGPDRTEARTNANSRRRFPSSSSSVSPVVSRRQRQRWIVISPAGWISSFVVWETDESRVFRRVFSRVFQTTPDFSGGCPGGCPGECPRSASPRPGTRDSRASSVLSAREVRAGVVGA